MAQILCDVIGCSDAAEWTLKDASHIGTIEENLCDAHYDKLRLEAPDQLELYYKVSESSDDRLNHGEETA